MNSKINKLLSSLISENKIFASFSLPEENSFQIIIQKNTEINFIDSLDIIDNKSGFIFSPFNKNEENKIILIQPDIVIKDDCFSEKKIINTQSNLSKEKCNKNIHSISKEEYLFQCKNMINEIKKGKFKKAVLSRIKLVKKSSDFDTVKLFISLAKINPEAFTYIVNIPGIGRWVGASPETLINIGNNKAKTIALAGTQKNTKKETNEIVWNKKEIEEQKYVIDYIRTILSKFKISEFQQSKTHTIKAGNIFHLQTKFEFNSEKLHNKLGKFIEAFHPTPAVCGSPKDEALKYILNNESHNREYYSGFLGPLNLNNSTSLFVNLRCLKVLPDKLAIFVGGGITKDSIPEKEWQETCHKSKTLLSVIKKLPTFAQ